jgi:predicted DNA-binding protein
VVRTQVHLTKTEQKALRALSKTTGQTQSEMIRRAVDEFIEKRNGLHHAELLRRGFGRGIFAAKAWNCPTLLSRQRPRCVGRNSQP